MNLVLFTHPDFLGSQSQSLFARMLESAYRCRGHTVELRQPRARLRRHVHGRAAKWAGYVDQYVFFPSELRRAIAGDRPDTLYVFCDQALGPWIPWVAHRPHVVHCHDLLALRSSLGDIPENPTAWTGRLYQRYIRRGFRHARHFISISQKSREDLHRFGGVVPLTSEVVYNGLNYAFHPISRESALYRLRQAGLPTGDRGCLLHVGGGQWYKNSVGVVALYASYVRAAANEGQPALPLWVVGPAPGESLRAELEHVPSQGRVQFFAGLESEVLMALYSYAQALLFPSFAEGFGWPIVEALACGCPVITTGEPPMTEVGGDAATYLPRLGHGDDVLAWATAGAQTLTRVLNRSSAERNCAALAGRAQAARFDAENAIESYLTVYRRVLSQHVTLSQKALKHEW